VQARALAKRLDAPLLPAAKPRLEKKLRWIDAW
jgi:hypothetical protein